MTAREWSLNRLGRPGLVHRLVGRLACHRQRFRSLPSRFSFPSQAASTSVPITNEAMQVVMNMCMASPHYDDTHCVRRPSKRFMGPARNAPRADRVPMPLLLALQGHGRAAPGCFASQMVTRIPIALTITPAIAATAALFAHRTVLVAGGLPRWTHRRASPRCRRG